jgi:broad specificity polyphosphatase/5'/3'-nucleotidase SurE
MNSLQQMITKLYSKVMHKNGDQASNALVINDPLSQLREVEGMLLLMLETREYIENNNSQEVQKRFVEAEKMVEKNRKQVRYEKKRR